MRRIPIINVTPSGANPGNIVLGATLDNPSGNWEAVFQGRYYRDAAGLTVPFYSSATTPAGYTLIQATTFTVIDNPSYAGRYTVYTQPDPLGLTSSVGGGGQTIVRVNEPIPAPISPADATSGQIINVSTYYITIPPAAPIIIPPETIAEGGVPGAVVPFDLPGRGFSGWGEIFLQTMARQVQHFAGPADPTNPFRPFRLTSPFVGQAWYNTSNGELRLFNGTAWELLNAGVFAPANSFKHTQSTSAPVWTINHDLGADAPFIVHASFFVDTPGGVKPILPADVSYVDSNTLTVTFSDAYTGYALIRL